MVVLAAIGLAAGLCAVFLSASSEASLIISSLSIVPAVMVIFGPLSDVRVDKTQGYLEFDRVLPMSHRAIAAARLFGSGVRTTPMILLVAPLFIAMYRHHEYGTATFMALVTFVPVGSWVFSHRADFCGC